MGDVVPLFIVVGYQGMRHWEINSSKADGRLDVHIPCTDASTIKRQIRQNSAQQVTKYRKWLNIFFKDRFMKGSYSSHSLSQLQNTINIPIHFKAVIFLWTIFFPSLLNLFIHGLSGYCMHRVLLNIFQFKVTVCQILFMGHCWQKIQVTGVKLRTEELMRIL